MKGKNAEREESPLKSFSLTYTSEPWYVSTPAHTHIQNEQSRVRVWERREKKRGEGEKERERDLTHAQGKTWYEEEAREVGRLEDRKTWARAKDCQQHKKIKEARIKSTLGSSGGSSPLGRGKGQIHSGISGWISNSVILPKWFLNFVLFLSRTI